MTGVLVVVPEGTTALPEDAWIRGVVDDGSDPIPGVYVKVMLFTAGGLDVGYDFTDVAGEYMIGLPGGFEYMVLAANGSYYMSLTMADVMAGETAWVNLTLEPIAPVVADITIKGYVMDEEGTPAVSGHVLGISNDPMGGDMPFYANVTTPDVSGYFEVNVIESSTGGGSVAFDNPGYQMVDNSTDSPLVGGETYWFNITLVSTSLVDDSRVSGEVTDSETGLPIEGVLVTVEIWNSYLPGDYANFTFTDSDGYYEMNVTNGTADIWFTKGGYSMAMFEEETINPGDDLQFDASLRSLNCVVKGNITDLDSGLPIAFARAVIMDMDGNIAFASTDGSGYYELDAFDGTDMMLGAEAEGYSRAYMFITLSPGDEVWHDFGLLPVSAWLEGTVTDVISGLPIEGAWVQAESDVYGDSDDSDATGYYNISLVPGDYTVRANTMDYREQNVDVTVVDDAATVQDFALIPWDLDETVLVSGYVTDADSADPISNARVRMALPDLSYQNSTYTDVDGFYEIYVAPLDDMPIGATAYMHAPSYDTLECEGLTSLMLDFQLAPDPYAPNLTYEQSPLTNISWTNPMVIDAEAEDLNMKQLLLFNFMPWYSEGGFDHLYIIEGASVSFDPFEPSSGLDYTQDGDNYTVQDEFNGTLDDSSVTGGWLDNGTGEVYLTAYKQSWGLDILYGIRAYYTNDTLTDMPGAAYFDSETGEYLMFYFDWGFPTADPDDLYGMIEPRVSHISIEEGNPSNWMWAEEAGLGESSVVGLTYIPDPLVPSGDYAMLFGVSDFGDQGNWFVTPYTVDNDLPVADAGPDLDVVVDVECTIDGSGSSDNVGIANYTWEFDDDSVPVTRYGESFDYTFTVAGSYDVTLTVVDGAGHDASDTMTVTVSLDASPVADAGPDQEADEDTVVSFDGDGSTDDVGVVNWTWSIPALSVDMYGATPEYMFAEPDVYIVELVVTDTIGQESDVDDMTVTVLDVTAPTADAGADQDVFYGDAVTFDGSLSDDNVGVASFEWTFDDDGSVSRSGETVDYTFSAPGEYTVTLTVADEAGNEDTDIMVVTVTDDEAPVADAGEDPVGVAAGDIVTLDGSGSTDNYAVEDYTWTFTDETDVTLDGVTADYTFENEGEFTITLTVSDNAGLTDTDTVVVRVGPTNEGPDADAGDDMTAAEGDTVEFDGSGSSDDVGIATYTWTFEYDDEVETLTGELAEFAFEIPGTYIVTLNVTDDEGEWDTDTVVVIVEEKASTFLTDYWWVLAAVAAIVVIGALAMLMKRGKSGPGPSKKADEDEELEEAELPPPDDEDL